VQTLGTNSPFGWACSPCSKGAQVIEPLQNISISAPATIAIYVFSNVSNMLTRVGISRPEFLK